MTRVRGGGATLNTMPSYRRRPTNRMRAGFPKILFESYRRRSTERRTVNIHRHRFHRSVHINVKSNHIKRQQRQLHRPHQVTSVVRCRWAAADSNVRRHRQSPESFSNNDRFRVIFRAAMQFEIISLRNCWTPK